MKNYMIGSDKCLVRMDSPLLKGWESCKDIALLMAHAKKLGKAVEEHITWVGSKMPATVFQKVLGTVAKFPRMETAFTLYYKMSDNSWHVKVPKQTGHGASVKFEDNGEDVPAGFALIGSIHTHPEMGAFWSGTDLNDQARKHGLHIVLGLRSGKVSTHLCSVFTPLGRYDQPLWDVVEETDLAKDYDAPGEWVEKIKAQELKPEPVIYAKPSYSYGRTWAPKPFGSSSYYEFKTRNPTIQADTGTPTIADNAAALAAERRERMLEAMQMGDSYDQLPEAGTSELSAARATFMSALERVIQKDDIKNVQLMLKSYGIIAYDVETGSDAAELDDLVSDPRHDDEDYTEDDDLVEELESLLDTIDEFAGPEGAPLLDGDLQELRCAVDDVMRKHGYIAESQIGEEDNEPEYQEVDKEG